LYYKSRTRSQRWVGIAPPRSPLHRDRATVHDVRSAVIAIACTLCTAHRKDKGVARELRLGCCRRTRRTRGERRRRRCGRVRRRSQRRLERRWLWLPSLRCWWRLGPRSAADPDAGLRVDRGVSPW